MKTPAALAASLASLAAAAALHAQTRVVYVDQTAPAGGDGTSWQRAFRDLQLALDDATRAENARAEVRVAQGVYSPQLTTSAQTVAFLFGVSTASAASLSLLGSFAGLRASNPDLRDFVATPTLLTADARRDDTPDGGNRDDNTSYLLIVNTGRGRGDNSIVIDGLVFEGARRSRYASAVSLSSWNGEVYVQNCIFRRNDNSGLSITSGNAHISDCVFRDNHAEYGGGLSVTYATARVERCLFENNSAERGGAINAGRAYVAGEWLIVRGNSAALYGGGLHGVASLRNSLVVGNSATIGGGLFDCYFVDFCTVVQNSAQWGGGLHGFGGSIVNSIFDGSSAVQGGDQISMAIDRLYIESSHITGGESDILLEFDASLSALNMTQGPARFRDPVGPDGRADTWQDNDYHLASGSIAINRARRIGSETIDLDGNPRSQPRLPGGPALPDLGCYEYQPRCPGDINQDDGVTTDDLLDFINAYTFGQPLADIDDGTQTNTPDDGVTIDDLLFFLVRYNQGC